MWLIFATFLFLNGFLNPIKCQFPSNEQTLSVCSDEYKINSYQLECQPGQGVFIKRAIQKFAKQNGEIPDCLAQGSLNYNFSRPFSDFCNGKMICIISSAFLDENKLFDAETYFLPDNSFYLKPYRIDITFDCSSKIVFTTTRPIFIDDTTEETTTRRTTTRQTTTTSTTTEIITTNTTLFTSTAIISNFTLNSTNITDLYNTTQSTTTVDIYNTTGNSSSKYKNFRDTTTTTEHVFKQKSGYISVDTLTQNNIGFNYFTIAFKTTTPFTTKETHVSTSTSTTTTTTTTTSTTTTASPTTSNKISKSSSTTSLKLKSSTKNETINPKNSTTSKMKFLNISGDSLTTQSIKAISFSKESTTSFLLQTSRINTKNESKISENADTKFLNKSNILYSDMNDLKNKYKSFKDPGMTTGTTTRVDSYVGNSETDRTVMIVLIVLGCVFFLIIIAIAILICIRRRNQAKLDREFGYKNDYNGEDSYSNEGNMSSIRGSIREKQISGPFSEISGMHSSRNMENLQGTYGTYRSRSNDGYDNSDKSVNSISGTIEGSKRPRIDSSEYWRTNV